MQIQMQVPAPQWRTCGHVDIRRQATSAAFDMCLIGWTKEQDRGAEAAAVMEQK